MSARTDDPIRRFTELLAASLADVRFVKAVLAKYRGPEVDLLATSHPARPLPTHPQECPPM